MITLSYPDWDASYSMTNNEFIEYAEEIIQPPIKWTKNVSRKAKLVVLVGRMCYEECFRVT